MSKKAAVIESSEEEVLHDDHSPSADLNAAWDAAESSESEPELDAGGEGEADTTPDSEPEPIVAEEGTPSPQDTPQEDKVPAGLSPALREEWKKTPKALQEWASKREKDYAVGLQKHAENAQRATQMDRVLQPFLPYLQMNGGLKAVPETLQTAMTLQMGTPKQRAEAAANLIHQFGVDINMLDSLLSGEQVREQAPQLSEREMRIEQFLQQQEQQQRWAVQQQQEQVVSGVQAFINDPKNEFASDVRDDMADLLEMASRRNIPMTLDQAYDRACRMNPEISRIMQTRSGQKHVQNNRRAASSIHGSPGGSILSNSGDSDDIAKILNEAWDRTGQV